MLRKIICTLVTISFLFSNTAAFTSEINKNNNHGYINLAPPLTLGDIIESRESGNLVLARMALEMDLRILDEAADIDGATNPVFIKYVFGKNERFKGAVAHEHGGSRVTCFFNEVEPVNPEHATHFFVIPITIEREGGEPFHCRLLFSTVRNEGEPFPSIFCTSEDIARANRIIETHYNLPEYFDRGRNSASGVRKTVDVTEKLELLMGKLAELPLISTALSGTREEKITQLRKYVLKTNEEGYYYKKGMADTAVLIDGRLGTLLGLSEEESPLYYTVALSGDLNLSGIHIMKEPTDLARDMVFKNALAEVFFDGGKTVLFRDGSNYMAATAVYGDRDLFEKGWVIAKGGVRIYDAQLLRKESEGSHKDVEDVKNAVRRYLRSFIDLGTLGISRIEGPDMRPTYMDVDGIMGLIDEVGVQASTDLGIELLPLTTSGRPENGYLSHDELRATSRTELEGICAALEDKDLLRKFGIDEKSPRTMIVSGFGEVGSNIIRLLMEESERYAKYNYRIIGFSDLAFGAFYKEAGFDLGDLYRIAEDMAKARKEGVKFTLHEDRYPSLHNSERPSLNEIIYKKTTIVIPAAIPYVIRSAEDINRLQCRIFASAANALLGTPTASPDEVLTIEKAMLARGIPNIPSWLLNFGGIACSDEEVVHRLMEPLGLKGMIEPSKREWLKAHVIGADLMDVAWVNAYWALYLWKKEGYKRPLAEIMQERAQRVLKIRKEILLPKTVPAALREKVLVADSAITKAKARVFMEDMAGDVAHLKASLNDKSAPIAVRRVAAYVTGRAGGEGYIENLLSIIEDDNENGIMYRNAATGLGYLWEDLRDKGDGEKTAHIRQRLIRISEKVAGAKSGSDSYERKIWVNWILDKMDGHLSDKPLQNIYPAVTIAGILKELPKEIAENVLNVPEDCMPRLANSLNIRPAIYDEKTGFIFSKNATFGWRDEVTQELHPGLAIILPKLANAGVKIAIVAPTEEQKVIVDELNKKVRDEDKKIHAVAGPEDAHAALSLSRYYYFTAAGEKAVDINGITTQDITEYVKRIIDIIGDICGISKGSEEHRKLHELALRFAQAA